MVELRDVSFSYGEKAVLEGISLRLDCPGAYAIWGPSGQGKTTLLHLMAGRSGPRAVKFASRVRRGWPSAFRRTG